MSPQDFVTLRDAVNRAEWAIRQLPYPGGKSEAAEKKRFAYNEIFTALLGARRVLISELKNQ